MDGDPASNPGKECQTKYYRDITSQPRAGRNTQWLPIPRVIWFLGKQLINVAGAFLFLNQWLGITRPDFLCNIRRNLLFIAVSPIISYVERKTNFQNFAKKVASESVQVFANYRLFCCSIQTLKLNRVVFFFLTFFLQRLVSFIPKLFAVSMVGFELFGEKGWPDKSVWIEHARSGPNKHLNR